MPSFKLRMNAPTSETIRLVPRCVSTIRMMAQPLDRRTHRFDHHRPHTRHAGHRHVVDEAARQPHDFPDPLRSAGRRQQEDEVQARGTGPPQQLLGILRRQVDDQQPVHSGRPRIGGEPLRAIVEDRIVVAVQDDRQLRGAAKIGHQLEHARQRGTGAQTDFRRALQDRAVGGRIGERHPDLQEIRTAGFGDAHQLARGVHVGITGDEKRDECGAPGSPQGSKGCVDAIHAYSVTPR